MLIESQTEMKWDCNDGGAAPLPRFGIDFGSDSNGRIEERTIYFSGEIDFVLLSQTNFLKEETTNQNAKYISNALVKHCKKDLQDTFAKRSLCKTWCGILV